METKDELLKSNKTRYLDKPEGPQWLSYNDLKAIADYYQENENLSIHLETCEDSENITKKAAAEIRKIQSSLQEGEQVGYLYNNNARDNEKKHAEAFIISKDKITKILLWNVGSSQQLNLEEAVNSSTSVFIRTTLPLIPQKGPSECGSLALAHLKNYLSDNAAQLREFTLSIPYYNSKQKLCYYFLPSPQVLRYSQSNLYNQFVKGIVQEGPQTLKISGEIEPLTTIEEVLQKTKTKAQELNNSELVEETEALLQKLPAFREKWLVEYKKTEAKRNKMVTSEEGKWGCFVEYRSPSNQKANVYLIYTTRRMQKIALNHSQKNSNPAKEILEQYEYETLEKSKTSAEILHYLQAELQKVKLSKPEEILYFLSKVDSQYYKGIMSSIEGFPRIVNAYTNVSYFLTSAQEQAMKEEKNFEQLIVKRKSDKDFSLTEIASWINFFKLSSDKIEQFFQDHFEEEWLKDQFQQQSHCLDALRKECGLEDTEEGKIAFAKLLNRYMPGWLEAQLPSLVSSQKLYNHLVLFFPGAIERENFINESFAKIDIRGILENKEAYEAYQILFDYGKCFANPKQSAVLEEDFLLLTLGKGEHSTFSYCHHLLCRYVDTDKAVEFLYKNRARIIESMINIEKLVLDGRSPCKDKLKIDFFCPEGDEILKNYFSKNKKSGLLIQILEFLPLEERESFINRISAQDRLTDKRVLKLLPTNAESNPESADNSNLSGAPVQATVKNQTNDIKLATNSFWEDLTLGVSAVVSFCAELVSKLFEPDSVSEEEAQANPLAIEAGKNPYTNEMLQGQPMTSPPQPAQAISENKEPGETGDNKAENSKAMESEVNTDPNFRPRI